MRAVAPGGLVPGLAVGGDDLVIGQDHVTLLLIAEGKLPPSRGRRRLCFLPPRLSNLPSAGGAPGAWRLGGRRRWCVVDTRSEEHTSEIQSLMRNSYAVFCLKKTNSCKDIELIASQHKRV